MKEHSVNRLNNFIHGLYGETDICDKLIEYFENYPNKKQGCFTANFLIDTSVKDSTDIIFNEDCQLRREYIQYLQKKLQEYVIKYPLCNECAPWQILRDGIQIQKYKPGGGYFSWHTERGSNHEPIVSRHLVFMTYLNTVPDDGETEFYFQGIKIKPEKGLTLFWPSDWTFTHRGITSMIHEKYIITGWYNFVHLEANQNIRDDPVLHVHSPNIL